MDKPQIGAQEVTSRSATFQDVLDTPPHLVAEIVDGTLYVHSRPTLLHAQVGSELGMIIGPPFHRGNGGPGGWLILDEPKVHLGDDFVVPDLAGWRRERLPKAQPVAYTELVPDWICEILSPSTRKFDREVKQVIYARAGVKHMWMIDPEACSLEAFALSGADWKLIDKLFDNVPVSLPPFEAISFDLGDLWGPPTIHKELPNKLTTESEHGLFGT